MRIQYDLNLKKTLAESSFRARSLHLLQSTVSPFPEVILGGIKLEQLKVI